MSHSTADRLRWLADVIDAVGDQGIDVHDAEPLGVDGDGDRLTAEVVCSAPRPDVLEDAGDEPSNEITEDDLESIAFVDEDEPDWETAEDLEEESPEEDEDVVDLAEETGTADAAADGDEEVDDEPSIFDSQTPAEEEFRERMDQEFGYADDDEEPELADEPIGPDPAPEDDDRDESLDEDEPIEDGADDAVADSTESDTTESASEADDPTTALAEDGEEETDDTDEEPRSDQEAIDEVVESIDRPDWLSRDADEIVTAHSNVSRSLGELLEIVENADTVIDVKLRAGCELFHAKDILWELGLREQAPDTMLLEEPERSERIETLREVYVDREVVA